MLKNEPLIEFKGITKRFGKTTANDQISCKVYPGQIHAFLGENGAGKSTLMKILSGYYQADSGEIIIDKKVCRFNNPGEARLTGIGTVHQNFSLIPSLTVSENIALGMRNGFFYNPSNYYKKIERFISESGITINPKAYIWELSQGERQRVEIFKLLFWGANIIVLDEPTSSLTPQESDLILEQMKRLALEGRTILFVTHKLSEVLKYADVITILRNGRVVNTLKASETSEAELADLMMGNEVGNNNTPKNWALGKELLKVSRLSLKGEHKRFVLSDIQFSINSGEILGVAGVSGNGQDALVDVLIGRRKNYHGDIIFSSDGITSNKNSNIKISYIPDDRLGVGTAPSLSIADNLMLRHFYIPPFCKGLLIDKDSFEKEVNKRIEKFNIKAGEPEDGLYTLSGGNLQKVILARELASDPDLIIAVNPTRGLDIASTKHVHHTLINQAARGIAIIIISENLDELIELSHRIMVLYNGMSMGIFKCDEVTKQQLGLCMGGQPAKSMGVIN